VIQEKLDGILYRKHKRIKKSKENPYGGLEFYFEFEWICLACNYKNIQKIVLRKRMDIYCRGCREISTIEFDIETLDRVQKL
jgi:hypothetical protein